MILSKKPNWQNKFSIDWKLNIESTWMRLHVISHIDPFLLIVFYFILLKIFFFFALTKRYRIRSKRSKIKQRIVFADEFEDRMMLENEWAKKQRIKNQHAFMWCLLFLLLQNDTEIGLFYFVFVFIFKTHSHLRQMELLFDIPRNCTEFEETKLMTKNDDTMPAIAIIIRIRFRIHFF